MGILYELGFILLCFSVVSIKVHCQDLLSDLLVDYISTECFSGEFECLGLRPGNEIQCVHVTKLCNGVEDCDDGSDEFACPECGIQSKIGRCATLDTGCPANIGRVNSAPTVKRRISGGVEAPIQAWPWMVAVGYNAKSGELITCGGSLITSRFVLTAAHCYEGHGWPWGFVRVGEHDLTRDEDCYSAENQWFDSCNTGKTQQIGIGRLDRHPDYKSKLCRGPCNDIALLRLRKNVVIDGIFVNTICLPRNLKQDIGATFEELKTGTNHGMITGWGHRNFADQRKGRISDKLQQAVVTIGANEHCEKTAENKTIYPERESIICAGDCSSGPPCRDTCSGDSGGPLLMSDVHNTKWFVIGITSVGPSQCGLLDEHTRYTNVIHYIDWIDGIVKRG